VFFAVLCLRARRKKEHEEKQSQEAPSTKETMLKVALFPSFAAPDWKPGSKAQSRSVRGKTKRLE
jgi:hypothetical protein